MNNELENLRVFSQFSGCCHYIEVDNEKFACIGGYVIQYSVAMAIMTWVMTTSRSYESLLYNPVKIELLIEMNSHDSTLTSMTDPGSIVFYLYNKIELLMREWSIDEFDKIIP